MMFHPELFAPKEHSMEMFMSPQIPDLDLAQWVPLQDLVQHQSSQILLGTERSRQISS